jgi:DNA polymerase V
MAHTLPLVDQLYRPGMKYLKAGVILGGLVPDAAIQGNLFMPASPGPAKGLMDVIDNLNVSMRDDIVKYAASGMTRNWKMRQELRSRRFTTRWAEMYEVH